MTNAERGLLRLLADLTLAWVAGDGRHKLKEALAALDAEAFWTQQREANGTAVAAAARVMERDKEVLQGLADFDSSTRWMKPPQSEVGGPSARRVPRYAPTHVSHGFDAPYPTTPAGRAHKAAQAIGWGSSSGAGAKAAGAAPEPSGAHYDREPSHEALKRAEQALINGWDVT